MKQLLILSFLFWSLAGAAQDSIVRPSWVVTLERFSGDCCLFIDHSHKVWSHWLWPFEKVMLSSNESGNKYRKHRRQYNRIMNKGKFKR